jgi:threonine dehydrogenase-like Zn-dependent dehydrogenase
MLPDTVPPGRAVLAANMETALNGVWDAAILPGDRVAVVGAGAVGCLVAWLAAGVRGCDVCLVDVNPSRARIANAFQVGFAPPQNAPSDCDVVVHASGAPEGLATAIGCAGFEATVVEMSWFGSTSVPLALGGAFHARRLTIRSSQVGHVPAARRARWTTRRRMGLALELLADPVLDLLITGEDSFDDLPRTMQGLAAGTIDAICHRIRY